LNSVFLVTLAVLWRLMNDYRMIIFFLLLFCCLRNCMGSILILREKRTRPAHCVTKSVSNSRLQQQKPQQWRQ